MNCIFAEFINILYSYDLFDNMLVTVWDRSNMEVNNIM